MYLAIPIILYASERLTRALRSSIKPVTIKKVNSLIFFFIKLLFFFPFLKVGVRESLESGLSVVIFHT